MEECFSFKETGVSFKRKHPFDTEKQSVSFKGTLRSFKRNGMLVGEEATKPLKGVNEFLFCLYRFPGLLYFMKGKELLI
mgnify:CR=1 FL=1